MNAIKTYKIANKKKGQVEYGYVGSKWNFRVGKHTLMYAVKGGKAVAEKIAKALHSSAIRCGKIDGTCRSVINRLLSVNTLADWRPDRDWWTNSSMAVPAVKMVFPHQQEVVAGFGEEDLIVDEPVAVVDEEKELVLV